VKTVYALDCAATVIGYDINSLVIIGKKIGFDIVDWINVA
jgi:hypothetical protein